MSSRYSLLHAFACAAILLIAAVDGQARDQSIRFTGLNVAGGEFGDVPGKLGKDYIYPSSDDLRRVAESGANIVRIPFRWERVQPVLGASLDQAELKYLDEIVAETRSLGLMVILDVHNYARHSGKQIGSRAVSYSDFAGFWREIADRYQSSGHVIFGLMNEPHDIAAEDWIRAANKATAAIRDAGARNLILVPGSNWSGAHSWLSDEHGTPNGTAFFEYYDPLDNFAVEVHQYLDRDYSGTHNRCQSGRVGVEGLEAFTLWARGNGMKAFLGEFGAANNQRCLAALSGMLSFMAANADVWIGWTGWAAGPWWPNDYPFNLNPNKELERPQVAVLKSYFVK